MINKKKARLSNERRKVEEIERQNKFEKDLIAEAKRNEVEYLKSLKDKDYSQFIVEKKNHRECVANDNKAFMDTLVEKDERAIRQAKNRQSMLNNMVKNEQEGQIVEKKRRSELEKRVKAEERVTLPIDKNEIAKQKLREIKDLEKNIIKNQCDNERRLKEDIKVQTRANEIEERARREHESRILSQKQVQEKLNRMQSMNQTLMKQMESKNLRDKLENQWRREGERGFANKGKDKVIRDKVNCQMCHKDY